MGNEVVIAAAPAWALTLQQCIMGRDWQGLLNKSGRTGIRTWCSSKQPNKESSDCFNVKLHSTRWLFKFFIHKKKEREGEKNPKKQKQTHRPCKMKMLSIGKGGRLYGSQEAVRNVLFWKLCFCSMAVSLSLCHIPFVPAFLCGD